MQTINLYTIHGTFLGQLQTYASTPIDIVSLHAISFPSPEMSGNHSNQLFFSA